MSPRRSRFRRRALRLTARGVVTLIAGVVALVAAYRGGWQELLVLGCAGLLLPVLGLVVARLGRPRLTVVRVFAPPIAPAGSPVRVALTVRSTQQRSSPAGSWNDGTPWGTDEGPHPLPALGPVDTPEAQRTLVYQLEPQRRGRYLVGPLAVETVDPFGMARSIGAQGDQDALVVVPAVLPLATGALSRADADGEAMLVHRRTVGNDDDLTTREYRPGDALRRVHWRASARHGELMVRQEEQRSFPEARLVIDTRRDGYPDAAIEPPRFDDVPHSESELFERAVVAAASVGVHLHEQGFRVSIAESAPAQLAGFGERWEGGRREEPFLVSLAGVALADPRPWRGSAGGSGGAGPGAGAGSAEGAASTGSGPVFAVVGSPAPETVTWLRRMRRPGEVAVALLGGDDEQAHAAASELRSAGWICVTGAAELGIAEAWGAAQREREVANGAR